MQLHEKYRPTDWPDVVGQSKAVRVLTSLRDRSGFTGRAYWLAGASGIGKTTIARLIAADVADDWMIEELDAGELTPARLRALETTMHLCAPGKGGRAFLVNEAHGMRKDTIRQLLVILERLPPHIVIIFTTTRDGQDALFDDCDDASPLLSRCVNVPLTNQGLASAFAARAREITHAEGLDGQPEAKYLALARTHRNNMRAMLTAIEAGAMLA